MIFDFTVVADIQKIMVNRSLIRCDVLDELGLSKSNVSIWTSLHSGTKVAEQTLEKLCQWFEANGNLIA